MKRSDLLAMTLEYMDQGISMVDADLNVVLFNSRFLELLDFPSDQFRHGDPFEKFIRFNAERGEYGPGDIDQLVQDRVKQARKFEPHQFVRTKADGIIVEIRGRPVPDGGFVTTYTDVTEQKRAEAALIESDELLRNLLDHSPSIIAIRDTNGRFKLINTAYEKMFDITNAEAKGKSLNEIMPNDFSEALSEYDQMVIETKKPLIHEHPAALKNGGDTLLSVRFPLIDDQGSVVAVGSIATDVTQMRYTEQALRKNEEYLQAILDNVVEGIVVINHQGRIAAFNPAAEKLFGYQASEVIAENVSVLMNEPEDSLHDTFLDAYIETSESKVIGVKARELEVRRKDGIVIPIELNVGEFILDDQSIFIGSMREISTRLDAEENLRLALADAEHANLAKSEFLAAMSHELRTPLNAILGFSGMLAGQFFGSLGSGKYKEYAEDIQSSGTHLLNLVNDILDISAIEAGEHALKKENVAINEVITDCSPIILEAANRKGIKFTTEIVDDPCTLHADPRALRQILLNVLSNSVKFTPEGGSVALRAMISDGLHTIEIIDSGRGIHSEDIGKLTEPFVRAETNPHTAQEGTGLGLAIVASLVDLHDGELDIMSDIGKGTKVTITLPNESP